VVFAPFVAYRVRARCREIAVQWRDCDRLEEASVYRINKWRECNEAIFLDLSSELVLQAVQDIPWPLGYHVKWCLVSRQCDIS
jgi:hypothetical protein